MKKENSCCDKCLDYTMDGGKICLNYMCKCHSRYGGMGGQGAIGAPGIKDLQESENRQYPVYRI